MGLQPLHFCGPPAEVCCFGVHCVATLHTDNVTAQSKDEKNPSALGLRVCVDVCTHVCSARSNEI